jgi:Tfp pilus assembly protein PilZ
MSKLPHSPIKSTERAIGQFASAQLFLCISLSIKKRSRFELLFRDFWPALRNGSLFVEWQRPVDFGMDTALS